MELAGVIIAIIYHLVGITDDLYGMKDRHEEKQRQQIERNIEIYPDIQERLEMIKENQDGNLGNE